MYQYKMLVRIYGFGGCVILIQSDVEIVSIKRLKLLIVEDLHHLAEIHPAMSDLKDITVADLKIIAGKVLMKEENEEEAEPKNLNEELLKQLNNPSLN